MTYGTFTGISNYSELKKVWWKSDIKSWNKKYSPDKIVCLIIFQRINEFTLKIGKYPSDDLNKPYRWKDFTFKIKELCGYKGSTEHFNECLYFLFEDPGIMNRNVCIREMLNLKFLKRIDDIILDIDFY